MEQTKKDWLDSRMDSLNGSFIYVDGVCIKSERIKGEMA